MNTLFISPNSPLESIGGVERYISNLIDYSKDQSKSNTIILMPSYKNEDEQKSGNTTIYYSNSLALPRAASIKEVSERALVFAKKVEEIISTHKIDVICAENFHIGLPPAYSLHLNMVAGLRKIPIVLRLHSFSATDIQTELVNQLMWKKVSCVSKSVSGDCFTKGADIDLLSTDYLGVDTQKFNINPNPKFKLRKMIGVPDTARILVTASRLIRGKKDILRDKGLINLVQAFSKIAPMYDDLYLLIAAGKSTDNLKTEFDDALEKLQGHIKLNHVEGRVIVKMFGMEEMPDIYRESNIFSLPSENETFGQVFIEAMACGVPVIGTNVGGIPEIISDNYNGFLVPVDDSSVLAQRIEDLLNDQRLRTSFVETAHKTVDEKFNFEKQFNQFFNLLAEVSKNNK